MVTFYVSSSPERHFRASSILNVFVTALIRVVHVITPGLIPTFIISVSTWRSSLHALKTMDKNPKQWLMKWHTYLLNLAEEHYASEMKSCFQKQKWTRQLQPIYCSVSSQSLSIGGEAPFLLMSLALPEVWSGIVTVHGKTLYSSFFIPCNMCRNGCKSLAPAILLSWECMSSGCMWSLSPLPTQNSSLAALKSFCHITNSQIRLDWIWSSLLWAAWQSEKTHFSVKSLHLFSSNCF